MPAPALDVWFVSTEQVYRGVPFQVAAGWVEQGRVVSEALRGTPPFEAALARLRQDG